MHLYLHLHLFRTFVHLNPHKLLDRGELKDKRNQSIRLTSTSECSPRAGSSRLQRADKDGALTSAFAIEQRSGAIMFI